MTAHGRRWLRCAPLLCLAAACGGGTPAPTAPAPVTVQGLSISPVPAVLDLGQHLTLTATVTLPDGAHKQTLSVAWESSNPAVATVSPAGLLTVTGYGDAQVRASAYGQTATARAFAPPPPKIRLAVTIDPYGSTAGMCDVTKVTFDMSGSSGTGLRYGLSYGDGVSDSEMVARHAFACPASVSGAGTSARAYSVHATVTDALERTDSANATVTVVDRLDKVNASTYTIAHLYQAVVIYPQAIGSLGRYLAFAHQSALTATGTYMSVDDPTHSWRPFNATLTGNDDLDVTLNDGTIHMSGHLVLDPTDCNVRIELTFSGGSANGRTLTFIPYYY